MPNRLRTWLARQDRVNRVAITVAAAGLIAFGGYRVWDYLAAERRADAARAALDRRDAKTARALLADALRSRPDSGELTFLAARAARLAGDTREADRLLTRSEELGWPESGVAFERALLRAQTGRFREVEPALVGYLRADPPPPDGDLVLEVVVPNYLREYDLATALDLLNRWAPLRPADVKLRLWQYEAAHRLGLREQATAALTAAVAAAPDDPTARLKLAEQHLNLNQPADARPHFDRLLARDPGRPAYRFGMARCEAAAGNTARAIELLDGLLAEDPAHPEYLAHRGYADLFAGRPREALPWLRKAAARHPSEVKLLANLALCLDQAGEAEEAKQWRDRAARAEADLREAERAAARVRAAPDDPEPRYELGTLLARNGHPGEARRWFESALRLRPDHAPARRALAELAARPLPPQPPHSP